MNDAAAGRVLTTPCSPQPRLAPGRFLPAEGTCSLTCHPGVSRRSRRGPASCPWVCLLLASHARDHVAGGSLFSASQLPALPSRLMPLEHPVCRHHPGGEATGRLQTLVRAASCRIPDGRGSAWRGQGWEAQGWFGARPSHSGGEAPRLSDLPSPCTVGGGLSACRGVLRIKREKKWRTCRPPGPVPRNSVHSQGLQNPRARDQAFWGTSKTAERNRRGPRVPRGSGKSVGLGSACLCALPHLS